MRRHAAVFDEFLGGVGRMNRIALKTLRARFLAAMKMTVPKAPWSAAT
jgi:hypothetical protein